MRRLPRTLPGLALGLILLLALTGCIHVDRSVVLHADGTGQYSLALGLSDQLVNLASTQVNASMDSTGADFKRQGGTFSKSDDGEYTTWTFVRHFASIAALNTLLSAPLPTTSADGATPTPATSTDSFAVTEQTGLVTNSFHVTGHMSMVASTINIPPSQTGGVDVNQMLKGMRESFAISFPGRITAHSGGSVNGSTITYTIHYGGSASIDVTGDGLTTSGVIAVVAGVVVLLLVLGLLVLWLVRRRAKRAKPLDVAATTIISPESGAGAVPVAVPYSPVEPEQAPPYGADDPTVPSMPTEPDAPTAQDER
ncbi:MAG: hypothetical protein ACHQ4H_03555 [Ktedonobacterales bacterium]